MIDTLMMLTRYKQWANDLVFKALLEIDQAEVTKQRHTRWESIAYTLSHVWVVDDIFRHHLTGRKHGYVIRNVDDRPSLDTTWARQREMDAWYCETVQGMSGAAAQDVIAFEFAGGGHGAMTRSEMILHIVNHGTYHRGLVSDMIYQIPIMPAANDLTVFLRDVWARERIAA